MRRILATAAAVAMLAGCCNTKEPERVEIKWTSDSFEELQEFFHYNPGKDVMISAHRGGMQEGFPENCIASCEKTISMMPTFFEIDFSFSKDSVMMLMHDLTLDRTTTGKGPVEDYTYEELQQFNLVDRQGNVTDYKIPTLKEVLEWGKDKCIFNFDNKYINTKGVSEERKKAALDFYIKQLSEGGEWSMYHNIMLSTRSYKETKYYWDNGVRNVIFCVEISSPEKFEEYENGDIPWDHLMAYVRIFVDPEMTEIYKKLHDRGVMLMTSITGGSDKVKKEFDRHVAYERDVLAEPDIIETDYPTQFIGIPVDRKTIHETQKAMLLK